LGSRHDLKQVKRGGRVTAIAIGFIVIAMMLCTAAVFGLLGIGRIALSGPAAIERDGLARGERAPTWSLTDSAGIVRKSPPEAPLQMIIFADHSMRSFPSLVAGLRALRDVEIVILTRGPGENSEAQLDQLGLAGIPVLTAGPALYADYNVRVMPFAIIVDSLGLVRASSLINYDWQVAKLRQIAAIELEPAV
jgi:hypothetical protein